MPTSVGSLAAWCAVAVAAVLTSLLSLILGAIRYHSRSKLEPLLRDAPRRRAQLDALLAAEDRLVIAVNALRGIAMTIGLVALATALVVRTIRTHGPDPDDLEWLWCGGEAVVLGTAFFVAFGQTIPRAIGEQRAEVVLVRFLPLVNLLRILSMPVIVPFTALHRLTLQVANVETPDEVQEIKDEILSAAMAGESEGLFDQTAMDVIKNVMEFRDVAVAEVMTSRTDVVSVDAKDDLPTLLRKAQEHQFSRLPVTDGSLDKVAGILVVKDLLRFIGPEGVKADVDTKALWRPAYFVPETKRIADLLRELRSRKVHMAIVADEYGGTAGLVTMEDLVEEIIGEIDDEHDKETHPPVRRLSDLELDIDGKVLIDDLNRSVGFKLPEEPEVDTVGGLLAMRLGKIPAKGDRLSLNGVTLTVTDADERRARRIHVKLQHVVVATNE